MCTLLHYNRKGVTFSENNGIVEVNASELARATDGDLTTWLNLPETKSLIDDVNVQLRALFGPDAPPAICRCWANSNYTILNSAVALSFAYWLSEDIGLWCDSAIKKLKSGSVLIDVTPRIPQDILRYLN